MNQDVAIIEGVYDLALPTVPTSLHRWGRIVWLHDLNVGSRGQLLFVEDGLFKKTRLSHISNIIRTKDYLEVHTQRSIYKLKYLVQNPS